VIVPQAGSSVPTAGATMSTAGTAAPAAGTGSSGTPNYTTCAGATTTGGPALHAAVVALLTQPSSPTAMNGPCAFSSCHAANVKKANLILDTVTMDLKAALVDKPSCEAPTYKLVDSSGGDAALQKSWLWQKLTAPDDTSGLITTKPEWGMPGSCGQMGVNFGVRMPYGSPDLWAPEKLATIRNWICAGAPGPM
jgi:hypothetical protein